MFYIQKFISVLVFVTGLTGYLAAQTLSKETILIETSYGNMKIKFYEETPLHKANFLKLVKAHFYDSLMFHRVINYFMIQGGDPLSRHALPGDSLGHGDIGYTIPAEISPGLIHKSGVLCAARESDGINPKFESSASQFYIVMGKVRSPEDLKKYEDRINKTRYVNCSRAYMAGETGRRLSRASDRLKQSGRSDSLLLLQSQIETMVQEACSKIPPYRFSARQTEVYTTTGGTPHLDGTYTVFGEVTEGQEVIDKIAAAKTDQRDRPLADIRMTIKLADK